MTSQKAKLIHQLANDIAGQALARLATCGCHVNTWAQHVRGPLTGVGYWHGEDVEVAVTRTCQAVCTTRVNGQSRVTLLHGDGGAT